MYTNIPSFIPPFHYFFPFLLWDVYISQCILKWVEQHWTEMNNKKKKKKKSSIGKISIVHSKWSTHRSSIYCSTPAVQTQVPVSNSVLTGGPCLLFWFSKFPHLWPHCIPLIFLSLSSAFLNSFVAF